MENRIIKRVYSFIILCFMVIGCSKIIYQSQETVVTEGPVSITHVVTATFTPTQTFTATPFLFDTPATIPTISSLSEHEPSSGKPSLSGDTVSFFRVKHDNPPRTSLKDWVNPKMQQAPEVFPLFVDATDKHGTHRTNLSTWESFCRSLNPTTRKWNYYTGAHAGLFNNTSWPNQESLTMGGNVVRVIEESKGFARIETLVLENGHAGATYKTHPWLIHKFTVITNDGRVLNPPVGDIYFPVVLKEGKQAWIPMIWLEKFPSLPRDVTVSALHLNVLSSPGITSPIVGSLDEGQTVTISGYSPMGSDVWGKTAGGWIALLYNDTYFTSWQMVTEPP